MLRLGITDALLTKQSQTTKHKNQNTYAGQLFEELIIKNYLLRSFQLRDKHVLTHVCSKKV